MAEPMTQAQRAQLKALCEEARQPFAKKPGSRSTRT